MQPTPTILLAALLLSQSCRPFHIIRTSFVVPVHTARRRKIGTNTNIDIVRSVSTAPFQTTDFSTRTTGSTTFYPRAPKNVADTSTETQIVASKTDAESFRQAANFMVDAYWLSSPTSLIAVNNSQSSSTAAVTLDEARNQLADVQLRDFVERYDGGRKNRLLHSRLLTAVGYSVGSIEPEIFGLVGMEVRLRDKRRQVIHSTQISEQIVLKAIGIEDKERMTQTPHCVPKLVDEMLPSELSAVCVLSNLAVSPKARRQGLATKLCKEVERIAASYCGCDQVYLEVEENNATARRLYEDKLGYVRIGKGDAPAKRVDLASGRFIDVMMPTLVLAKDIDEQ